MEAICIKPSISIEKPSFSIEKPIILIEKLSFLIWNSDLDRKIKYFKFFNP